MCPNTHPLFPPHITITNSILSRRFLINCGSIVRGFNVYMLIALRYEGASRCSQESAAAKGVAITTPGGPGG